MSPIEYQFVGYTYDHLTEAMRANPLSSDPATLQSTFEGNEDEKIGVPHDEEQEEDEDEDEDGDWDWDAVIDEAEKGKKKPLTEEQKRIKDKIRQHQTRQADKEVADVLKEVLKEHHNFIWSILSSDLALPLAPAVQGSFGGQGRGGGVEERPNNGRARQRDRRAAEGESCAEEVDRRKRYVEAASAIRRKSRDAAIVDGGRWQWPDGADVSRRV